MSRRRSTILTMGVALTLALPLGAAQASQQPEEHGPGATGGSAPSDQLVADQRTLRAEVTAAAQQAADLRQGRTGAQQKHHTQGEGLQQAAQGVVDDGAIGVTARVETDTLEWSGAAGVREVGKNPKALAQSPFRTASITKPMVATVVLQEIEAGTFALDTPVDDIIPGLFPDQPGVTVEHLLSHRSGVQTGTELSLAVKIGDGTTWEDFIAALGADYTDEEHLAIVNEAEWLFEPGADFSYSNAGYIALGMILEEVTGQDVEDLLADRVFSQARMRHTALPDDPGTRGPFLQEAADTGPVEQGGLGWVSLAHFNPELFSSAGAATTTTADLNSFTESLLTGDLVDPALVQDMITPRSEEEQYGLGIYRIPDPCTPEGQPAQWLYGHDGLGFGGSSMAFTSPEGDRQFSFSVTGRNLAGEPHYDITELLVPMLLATC